MPKPKIDLQAYVDNNQNVFLVFYDGNVSSTVTLTPDQAISVGDVGSMAKYRMEARDAESMVPGHLPVEDSRVEKTISDMKVGESTYTVPWAVSLAKGNIPFINLTFTTQKTSGGTVQMLVQRLGQNQWQVQLPKSHRFHKQEPHPDWKVSYNLNVI